MRSDPHKSMQGLISSNVPNLCRSKRVRFTVDRDVFNEAVSFTAKLLPQRPTQPILSGVLLVASEENIELGTFDYETSSKTSITADISETGRALVSGRLLAEIASKLPHSDVNVIREDDRVVISCGSATFSLPSMPVEEYPQIPEVNESSGTVKAEDFAAAVAQVSLAASKEDVTPVITGVFFEVKDSTLTMTATDRYRVATRGIPWTSDVDEEHLTALVPAKIVAEVGKTFGSDGDVKITIVKESDRELIAFTGGSKTVTSVIIKGNYPPVQRLFPEQVDNYAVVSTSDILEAVGRVGLVLEREAALRFTFSEGSVQLEGAGSESARANETTDAHLVGDDMIVSLKPQFLLDGLRSTHADFARIGFTKTDNPAKPGPVLISGQHSRDEQSPDSFKYLLQPNLLLR